MQSEYNLRKQHVTFPLSSLHQKPSKVHHLQTQSFEDNTGNKSMSDNPTNNLEEDQQIPKQQSHHTTNSTGNTPDSPEVPEGQQSSKKEVPVIHMTDFSAVDMEEKMNLLMIAINKINTNFHHKFEDFNQKLSSGDLTLQNCIKNCQASIDDQHKVLNDEQDGVLPRLRDAESAISDLQSRVETLEEEKTNLLDEIYALKGYAQVQDKKLAAAEDKIIDLTARSMKNNILIQGLPGDPGNHKEDCKGKVLSFLKNEMKMEIKDSDVLIAHRIGRKLTVKHHTMVVKCDYNLREKVFKHTKYLKDIKNDQNDYYRVSPQLPESMLTKVRERREAIIAAKNLNKTLNPSKQIKIEVKNGTLHLDGKAHK